MFVYGSLRPDDPDAEDWIKQACQGLQAQKAILRGAKLYCDKYATVIKNPPLKSTRSKPDNSSVVGWVLTHEDEDIFAQRLKEYDAIQGYDEDNPQDGFYIRDIC